MFQLLSSYLYQDEPASVQALLEALNWPENRARTVSDKAETLIEALRNGKGKAAGELEGFLQQYGLDTEEGLALMTLAEALLRIPDAKTAGDLIRDKVQAANWLQSLGGAKDWKTKAAGFGLALTSKTLDGVFSKLGEPVIRESMIRAMQMMGKQFVLGTSIENAMDRSGAYPRYRFSYDMLGEGARTAADAERYYNSYIYAIEAIARHPKPESIMNNGISVKLSALHPRYDYPSHEVCIPALSEKLEALAQIACRHNLTLTVDAEESERLELSLQIFENVLQNPEFKDWDGFGLAVQAYQKRCLPLIDHVYSLAQTYNRTIQCRLVKGAYWDREIKVAQMQNAPDYPVFTRKSNTDLSYLSCAQKMIEYGDSIYPMFATHNAHSIAAIIEMTKGKGLEWEFQRLHGMGETLYSIVLDQNPNIKACIYAPVGPYSDLLPYLVRRLLENGANTSFVNQIMDEDIPAANLAQDPVFDAAMHETKRHPYIVMPDNLYKDRQNSHGIDLNDDKTVRSLTGRIAALRDTQWQAFPLVGDRGPKRDVKRDIKHDGDAEGAERTAMSPADSAHSLGRVVDAGERDIDQAFKSAKIAQKQWLKTSIHKRSEFLLKIADLYEDHHDDLMALMVYETGKTIHDAHMEVREAVDFCRYYAHQAAAQFPDDGTAMEGPTGESNILYYEGRGIFVCISPWNFPMAIFTGQIVAALVCGNAVLAKPAEQSPLIGFEIIKLMHQAGVPKDVLHFLPGDGGVGANLVAHPHVDGVAFTGSTAAAKSIQRALAAKEGAIVPLIAETGGQNAMIVDSSALLEQVVDDVLISAFGSAGQRCSALRLLCVQTDIADPLIEMLKGAMAELRIGHPAFMSTDIGPVIDRDALEMLKDYQNKMDKIGQKIYQLGGDIKDGYYFSPAAYEISEIEDLGPEIFGPFLHVLRYDARDAEPLVEKINALGYGLTFGVHSRIDSFKTMVSDTIAAGNVYVNKGMTGAVVGTQPFGGRGLSGTGPKAGGPNYLHGFVSEKTVSINTTASGGNASLVNLHEK